jgi:hypothetical protein
MVSDADWQQASAVFVLARLEMIDAPPRTEGSSPGIVPDETKTPIADGAAFDSFPATKLNMIAHF